MRILILGSGGREHALAWKCAQDRRVTEVLVAPGNAGTAREPRCRNVDLDIMDNAAVVAFARAHADLTLVGPEAPLVHGVIDALRQAGLAAFGPSAACARLEGSKSFAKAFMQEHAIPTAAYASFDDLTAALAYLDQHPAPIVIKADGLAAGKGVVVAMSDAEARAAVQDMLGDQVFGSAGARVVIEEFLQGEEASFICMVDGQHILAMASSQDHKRVGEGDSGPNTGGMGAYSPAPVVNAAVHERIMQKIIAPTVAGMAAAGTPYTGFLYAGVMIDAQGEPYVIEFNCRFGDPETQPVMMRLESSLPELLELALAGQLDRAQARWSEQAALGIVLAAPGYPGKLHTGERISGLDADEGAHVKTFLAGVREQDGQLYVHGGRVLCVTALAADVGAARVRALARLAELHSPGCHYRRDIGARAIAREQPE